MQLSIVTTLYRTSGALAEFHRRATAAARDITDSYEIVMVNDGSPDDAGPRAIALHQADSHVVVVDLSRNFGHHRAMMAGLARARGESVFLIDSDLEEDPAWLSNFWAIRAREGADVVYGVQTRRKGGPFERLLGWLFYRTLNLLFEYPVPDNLVTARLMSRRYVRALVAHRERHFAIAGLWAMTGFSQVAVPVVKHSLGRTTYGFFTRVAALVNAVTAFTARPLIWIFYLGAGLMALAMAAAGYLVAARLFYQTYLEGWVSVFVSIWFLGGLTLFCLGVIGIYLSKVFEETKRRPYVTVRALYRRNGPES